MTKKEKEQSPEELLNEAFAQWNKLLCDLETQANAGYMPLLAKTFVFSKEILAMYERAFKSGIKKE